MIECNNAEISFPADGYVTLIFDKNYDDALATLEKKLHEKHITQCYVKIGKPRRPRTTGPKGAKDKGSQQYHLNGHIQQICAETGDEFDDIKMEIKRRAIKRGYPFHTDSFGNVIPESEANASTVECGYLIDEAHDVAAFCNVRLKEM